MTESQTSENEWSFGHCSSSQEWRGPGTYIEKCCVSEGKHLLTCSTSRHKNDWSSIDLRMLGHRFCDDFVGYEALIELDVSGALIYIIHIESIV